MTLTVILLPHLSLFATIQSNMSLYKNSLISSIVPKNITQQIAGTK